MKNKNHLPFALVGSLIIIVLAFIQYFAGISSQNGLFKWLPTLVLAGTIIWGCINYSKINDADVTFGEVFGNGFRITAIMTLIAIGFMLLFVTLFPDYKERLIEESMQAAASSGRGGSEEDTEKAMEMVRKNFMLFMIAGGLFMYLLIGVVSSLVGAAVAKKKKQ
ncbi:DUF4199 domain-containing protein [Chitinophaga lutea]|uniref:DUF4199 domain-containing protein n=1 Tax=Chitinophaga lutea TaxID=2488634 RepID=A0A3N4PCH6_9BACT|nr:DUF4199 domain-containing protein [Chitinophaga lutea]RPE05926.1 DUF4199 domain-containing protein [Chitinophaga lutea]